MRSAPSASFTTLRRSAPKKITSPARAPVGLVAAVARGGLGVREPRESSQVHVEHPLEDVADQALHQVLDLALVEERGLDVDLGELGLALGAQVLVAEALHDLVVAIEA